MKEKLLLVGAGGFGRVVLEHAQQVFDCALVDDGYAPGTVINGAEVVGKVGDIAGLFGEYLVTVPEDGVVKDGCSVR